MTDRFTASKDVKNLKDIEKFLDTPELLEIKDMILDVLSSVKGDPVKIGHTRNGYGETEVYVQYEEPIEVPKNPYKEIDVRMALRAYGEDTLCIGTNKYSGSYKNYYASAGYKGD